MNIQLTCEEFKELFNKEPQSIVSDELIERLVQRYKENKDKIGAVMLMRAVKGWSLVEAKKYCDIKWGD